MECEVHGVKVSGQYCFDILLSQHTRVLDAINA